MLFLSRSLVSAAGTSCSCTPRLLQSGGGQSCRGSRTVCPRLLPAPAAEEEEDTSLEDQWQDEEYFGSYGTLVRNVQRSHCYACYANSIQFNTSLLCPDCNSGTLLKQGNMMYTYNHNINVNHNCTAATHSIIDKYKQKQRLQFAMSKIAFSTKCKSTPPT